MQERAQASQPHQLHRQVTRIATQVFEMADEGNPTKNKVPAPATPPGLPPSQQPEDEEDEYDHDETSELDNINSMQQDIDQTVTKGETLLHQINDLLVTQHQLVVFMIAGCKQQLDVMEVLLRQNATDWS